MEIERKWIFEEMPEVVGKVIERSYMRQGYISVDPEVRIREKRIGDESKYTLTIKSKGDMERIEVEKELTKKEFDELTVVGHLKDEDFIEKYQSKIALDRYEKFILELNSVDPTKDSRMIYGEIEFNTLEDANNFITPQWFGREITNDPSYKMSFRAKISKNNK